MSYLYVLVLSTVLMTETLAKIIDLSHDHGPDTLMSPNAPHFNRSTLFAGERLPGVYVEAGQYSSGEHGGTHLDAPGHLRKGGMKLHEIPLENTIANGVMIDCSEEASRLSSYLVPVQKILDWEKQHGHIPAGAAVLFNFGWSSKFSNKALYLGSESDDQYTFVFPALSAEVGSWLYDNRDARIIGTDTLSPDPININGKKITSFPIHQKYLPNNRLIIENMNGLERLPPTGFRLHAAPVKFVGATGAQIRAYAMTYDEDFSRSIVGCQAKQNFIIVVLLAFIVMLQF